MTRKIEGKIAGDLRAAYDGATPPPTASAQELGVGDVAAAYRVQEINTASVRPVTSWRPKGDDQRTDPEAVGWRTAIPTTR